MNVSIYSQFKYEYLYLLLTPETILLLEVGKGLFQYEISLFLLAIMPWDNLYLSFIQRELQTRCYN